MNTQSSQIFGIFNVFFSFPKATFKEGDDVNDVVLSQSQTENPTTIKAFNGKWLVLFFYPMDNSPGCTKEAKTFSSLIDEFQDQNAEVIGVSMNSEAKHRKFIEQKNLRLRLLSDADGRLARLFGIKILFGMCSRDSVLINPRGKVEVIYKSVNPASSPEQILNQIAEKNGRKAE